MTDIEKLIRRLRNDADAYRNGETLGRAFADQEDVLDNAATALSTLQAENEEMQKKLNEFSEFLCHMTGGMLSKTNYTAQAMISAAEDYQQRVCDNYCDLRVDLARVTAERDAAVEDVAAIIGDVEEIRRGYGVDNADADGAFAELCETYCANNGRLCYAECEKYHCKNFKWRGQKEG